MKFKRISILIWQRLTKYTNVCHYSKLKACYVLLVNHKDISENYVLQNFKIIENDNYSLYFQSTVFLEPFTADVGSPIKNGMPALMYGTQLSEEGLKCAIPGFDYNKLYDIWSCPRIVMNVAVCIS